MRDHGSFVLLAQKEVLRALKLLWRRTRSQKHGLNF